MTARRLRLVAAPIAAIVALAGCGGDSKNVPEVSKLPLVSGAQVVTQARQCDKGANAFCAIELVVVDRRYKDSLALLLGERDLLRSNGWTGANPDTGEQAADDSPGHKLRVTYATAAGDLKGIDLNWIKRARPVTLALSHAMFAQSPTLSMMLEIGAS
jgi:hypothetical protein